MYIITLQQLLCQYRARILSLQQDLGQDIGMARTSHLLNPNEELRRLQTENVSSTLRIINIFKGTFNKLSLMELYTRISIAIPPINRLSKLSKLVLCPLLGKQYKLMANITSIVETTQFL